MNLELLKIGTICLFLLFVVDLKADRSISIPVREHQFYASEGNIDRWQMEVQNWSGSDAIIYDIAFPDSCHFNTSANFPFIIRSGDVITLPIDFISPGLGDFDCVAYVLSNDQYHDSIPIELYGTGLYTGPEIILITEEVFFDEARTGSSNAAFLRFFNFGDADVMIDSISLESENFWLSEHQDLPSKVSSLDTCFIQVWFIPDDETSFSDTLWIYHNDSLGKTLVLLRGDGIIVNYINGSPIWHTENFETGTIYQCGDINKDGYGDLLSFKWKKSLSCVNVNSSHKADIIWTTGINDSINLTDQNMFIFSSIADYNIDTFEDILLFCHDDFYHTAIISGRNGKFLRFDTIVECPENFYAGSFKKIYDYNQDGVKEIVFGDFDWEEEPMFHKVYCVDYINGELLWSTELIMQAIHVFVYEDMNFDDIPEILVYASNPHRTKGRIAILNGSDGQHLKYIDFETERLHYLRSIEDINDDGHCELLISDYEYKTYIFDLINEEILNIGRLPHTIPGSFKEIGDVNGDGYKDYFPTNTYDSMYVISGYSAEYIWKKYLNWYHYRICIIDDLTYDGIPEIVASPGGTEPDPQYYLNGATGEVIKAGLNVNTDRIIAVDDVNGDACKDFIVSWSLSPLIMCQSGAIGVHTGGKEQNELSDHFLICHPNPFYNKLEISFELLLKQKIQIQIRDIEGRIVNQLIDEIFEKGQYTVQWNGTDAKGHELPPGIYFVSLKSGGNTFTEKIIKQ